MSDLRTQVEAQRDYYETLYALLNGQVDNDTVATLTDELDIERDEDGDITNADEIQEQAREMFDSSALDLEIHGMYEHGAWRVTHVVLVVCTGGPHVELDTSDNMWHGCWGGETVRLGADDAVCDYLDECAADVQS